MTDDASDLHQSPAGEARELHEDDLRMLRIQAGEAGAFDELVSLFQGPLFGFFLRNTRDAQMSEDLTQETLLRVFNQAWDYLPRGRFRGWLFRVARNLMIDCFRRQSHDALVKAVKGRADDEDEALARIAGDVVPPEIRANQREVVELVDTLLAQLPHDQRMTFTLYHYSGLSLPEVAEIMEVALPTCKSRLRLAREKLREKLGPYGIREASEFDGEEE